jgi:hypothetical protein
LLWTGATLRTRSRWDLMEPIEPESATIGPHPGAMGEPIEEANPAIPGRVTATRRELEGPTGTPATGTGGPTGATAMATLATPASPLLQATAAVRAALDASIAAGDIEGARRAMRALDALLGGPPTLGQDAPTSRVKSARKRRE